MNVDAAVVMVQRYNPASVFVSCDDPAAASEFEVALRGAGIHISIVTAGVGDIYQGRSLLEDRVGWENVEYPPMSRGPLFETSLCSRDRNSLS